MGCSCSFGPGRDVNADSDPSRALPAQTLPHSGLPMKLASVLAGSTWNWCHDSDTPGGVIKFRLDGRCEAWGVSTWQVVNDETREVVVDDIGGAGVHRLYFNEQVTGFFCSHSGQRGFICNQGFTSPDHARAPRSCPVLRKEADFGMMSIKDKKLHSMLQHSVMAYAKGSEILRFAELGKPLCCRQVMEVTHPIFYCSSSDAWEALQTNNFISFSYAWISKEHPDPSMFHLRRIAFVIKAYMQHDGRDPMVFMGWISLYQKNCREMPRTDHQQRLFCEAMSIMHENYGHQGARVVLLPDLPRPRDVDSKDYDDRGWPSFEQCCAFLGANWVVRFSMTEQQMQKMDQASPKELGHVIHKFRAKRQPPMLPDDVNRMLASKVFTNGSDLNHVKNLYDTFFKHTVFEIKKLALCNIGADDKWVEALARVLPFYANLEALDLGGAYNSITDRGAHALLVAQRDCPKLRWISLLDARISRGMHQQWTSEFRGRDLHLGPSA